MGSRGSVVVLKKEFEGVSLTSHLKVTLEKKLLKVEQQGDLSALEALWRAAMKSQKLMDALWVSAAKAGHLRIVRWLVKKNGHAGEKESALMAAIRHEQKPVVQVLLDAGVHPDAQGCLALPVAIGTGDISLVKSLLCAGADPDARGMSVIAAARRETAMLDLLLEKGAQIDGRVPDLMGIAAGSKDLRLATWLLDRVPQRMPANAEVWRSVAWHLPLLRSMVEKCGMPARECMDEVLQMAVSYKKKNVILWALENGASPLDQNMSPLSLAVMTGNRNMAAFLVLRGASPRAMRKKGIINESYSGQVWVEMLALEERFLLDGILPASKAKSRIRRI